MPIDMKCPACGTVNQYTLDSFMGKIAVCNGCASMLKLTRDGNAPKIIDKGKLRTPPPGTGKSKN